MDKYQICLTVRDMSTAGTKAPQDMCTIAKNAGYHPLSLSRSTTKKNIFEKICEKLNLLTGYAIGWLRAYCTVTTEAVVLLQIPNDHTSFWGRLTLKRLREKKQIKLICLIHDVDELRLGPSNYLTKSKRLHDFSMEYADAIIAHNESMVTYLASQNISRAKLVSLEIFDYLANAAEKEMEPFDRSAVIAGNLDPNKCGYITEIGTITGVNWVLYGPNYDNSLDACGNISYCGKVVPEVLPQKLTKGFGVIWDGSSVDSCTGSMGAYLRYNNPHKLSLYLTAGLPVVIWDQAAEAKFVQKHGLGICVASLRDLQKVFDTVDPVSYSQMAARVDAIGSKLRSGHYLTTALTAAEKICQQTRVF